MRFDLEVNGQRRTVNVDASCTLLSVLREELALTGTKYGCGEGQCGACTVLLNGRAVRSCRTEISRATAARVTTIEGLERDGRLHPLVPRFSDVPAIDVVLIDRKDQPSFGSGETPIMALAPAVGSAIFGATGFRPRQLPMARGGIKLSASDQGP
jgi:ferredoxin